MAHQTRPVNYGLPGDSGWSCMCNCDDHSPQVDCRPINATHNGGKCKPCTGKDIDVALQPGESPEDAAAAMTRGSGFSAIDMKLVREVGDAGHPVFRIFGPDIDVQDFLRFWDYLDKDASDFPY